MTKRIPPDGVQSLHNKRKPTKNKPIISPHLKLSAEGLRADRDSSKKKYTDILPKMMEHAANLVSFSTACDACGVDAEAYAGWVARYPAIRDELKRARAEALIQLQRDVAKGAQGWQALCRIAEMADPGNWAKAAPGRPGQAATPYSQIMQSARKKSGR